MPADWGYYAVAIIGAAIFVLSFAWSEHKEEKP